MTRSLQICEMEFVEGWDIVQVLGEGAFGEVRRPFSSTAFLRILDALRVRRSILTRFIAMSFKVKLLVNRKTSEAVAVKLVDLRVHLTAISEIRKEIGIHKLLSHDNILKCFGHRKDDKFQYIFLEYAAGGELFDRIEPDVGMDPGQAQKYFQQLIAGVVSSTI